MNTAVVKDADTCEKLTASATYAESVQSVRQAMSESCNKNDTVSNVNYFVRFSTNRTARSRTSGG